MIVMLPRPEGEHCCGRERPSIRLPVTKILSWGCKDKVPFECRSSQATPIAQNNDYFSYFFPELIDSYCRDCYHLIFKFHQGNFGHWQNAPFSKHLGSQWWQYSELSNSDWQLGRSPRYFPWSRNLNVPDSHPNDSLFGSHFSQNSRDYIHFWSYFGHGKWRCSQF